MASYARNTVIMIQIETHSIHEAIETIDKCIAFLHGQTEVDGWLVLYTQRIILMDILKDIARLDEYRLNKITEAIQKAMSLDISIDQMLDRIKHDPTV